LVILDDGGGGLGELVFEGGQHLVAHAGRDLADLVFGFFDHGLEIQPDGVEHFDRFGNLDRRQAGCDDGGTLDRQAKFERFVVLGRDSRDASW
jgi:hypothetical protein